MWIYINNLYNFIKFIVKYITTYLNDWSKFSLSIYELVLCMRNYIKFRPKKNY